MPPARSSPRRLPATRLVLTIAAVMLVFGVASHPSGQVARTGWTVVAWNNLGMHCMDADFNVFSILPPYNTIQAQVVDPAGKLAGDGTGIRLTYEPVADPLGSINSTSGPIGASSQAKTNFWVNVLTLFGVNLPVDAGLHGHNMPGPSNTPQGMEYDAGLKWFIAEGIPITPYDDAGRKNYYPMMKVTARSSAGAVLASTNIVLPVSDEMDCSLCHASGSGPAARPSAGWVNDPDTQHDFRLNILRLHDEQESGNPTFAAALAAKGYTGGPVRDGHERQVHPLRELPPVGGAPGHGLHGSLAAHRSHARRPRGRDRSHQRDDPRHRHEPLSLLPLPPGVRNALPARHHGQQRRGRRVDGDPVPELPRPDVRCRRVHADGLAGRTDVPAVPHGDRHQQQRRRSGTRPSLNRRVRRAWRASP